MTAKTQWFITYIILWILFTVAIWPLALGHYFVALACGMGLVWIGEWKAKL